MGQWAKYPDIRFLGDDDQDNTGTSEIVGFQLGLRNGSSWWVMIFMAVKDGWENHLYLVNDGDIHGAFCYGSFVIVRNVSLKSSPEKSDRIHGIFEGSCGGP